MKKRILLTIATATLLMSGCADKKLTTDVGEDGTTSGLYGDGTQVYGTDGVNSARTGSYGYGGSDNVDPYGSGNYGNQNGTYGSGTYGNTNGGYGGGTSGVENIYFGVNQYTITADKVPTIHSNANLLRKKLSSGSKLRVDGHCDASGSDEYNYALGLRRAKATKDALIIKGINAGSISLVSMGESSPECSDSMSSDCYSKNRRVEFNVAR
jgi:outer membrane protein OmpA-like peptidoglycan-associated protein